MVRGRYNRITRTVGLALAALFTLAGPLSASDALATEGDGAAKAEPQKVTTPSTKKSKKHASAKKTAKASASGAKPQKKSTKRSETSAASTSRAADASVVHAKHTAPKSAAKSAPTTTASAKKAPTSKGSAQSAKKAPKTAMDVPASTRPATTSKKASARAPGAKRKSGKKADADAERPPCFATAVSIDRNGLENETFSLVDCKGKPLETAREKLSVLARPWGTPRPTIEPKKKGKKSDKKPGGKDQSVESAAVELAPNVRLLDAGLLTRIETIAKHFPGKHISIVSGYRPRSRGSLHQSARAIDLRVAGVSNEEVVAFCKTMTDTGCGYYPNSSFVHVDVRAPGTGSVSWIDASGPGEAPRYVAAWPPPPEPQAPDADVHDGATAEGIEDEVLSDRPAPSPSASRPTSPETSPDKPRPEPAKEADPKDPITPPSAPAAPPAPADKVAPKEATTPVSPTTSAPIAR